MPFAQYCVEAQTTNEDSIFTRQSDTLSVSIVLFRPDADMLRRTINTLATAVSCLNAAAGRTTLYLIDNGGLKEIVEASTVAADVPLDIVVLSGHGNIGYGRGHNLVVEKTQSEFHLILNPDVELDANGLREALAFFRTSPQAGLLVPWIGDQDGRQQYLCRRFPSVLDLFVRGFLPARWRSFFAARLAHYEMRDVMNAFHIVWDPPIVSGCFMLFRTSILRKLGGFDPRYFLYFEDYDLSLRTRRITRIVYVPSVRILHHGGGAARKGGQHIMLFVTSAYRFFNRFGWKWI